MNAVEMSAGARAMQAARTALVLDQPFWGALALRLVLEEDPTCATAWVDGRTLGFNPTYVEGLTADAARCLIAHEVMHCAMGHPWRRGARDHRRWNVAADYAINAVLEEAGFVPFSDGWLRDEQWDGCSSEWIYDRLPPEGAGGQDQGSGGSEDGDESGAAGAASDSEEDDGDESGAAGSSSDEDAGDDGGAGGESDEEGDDGSDAENGRETDDDPEGDRNDGGGDSEGESTPPRAPGEVRDAPAEAREDGSHGEADWQQAVQQAATAAKARGSLPGALERFAEKAAEPRVDWRGVLRRFVTEVARADYSWRRPNRRHIGRGVYLPALHSEEVGPVVVVYDTSGSIDDVTGAQFGAEIDGVVDEVKPRHVDVVYADAKVQRVDRFERGEPIELNPIGGGGTAFGPAFEWIETLEEPPACVVYLTDLYGSFPSLPPEVPVLWVTVGRTDAPFGEVVPLR